MNDEAPLEQSVDGKPELGPHAPYPGVLGAAGEVSAGGTVSQIQMDCLNRLARGGTLKENMVDVLIVSTIIRPPFA